MQNRMNRYVPWCDPCAPAIDVRESLESELVKLLFLKAALETDLCRTADALRALDGADDVARQDDCTRRVNAPEDGWRCP